MNQLDHVEKSRIYHYPDGSRAVFQQVTAVGVTKSGFHKLEADGEKYIVAPGWRYIQLTTKDWSF